MGTAKFGPDTFVVIEKWESADALKAHSAAPHMAAYAGKTREHIASRVIHVLSPT
jgi:quinol monooxygenase YgiN